MINQDCTKDLIIVCIPKNFPIGIFDGIVSKCLVGVSKEIEKWSIASIEEYVGRRSLFRIPNEVKKWVCTDHGGIVSGRIPSNPMYGVLKIYRNFATPELEYADLLEAIERYFSEVKKLAVEPFLQRFSSGPTLSSLEKFTRLIAQEVWDERRSSKEPLFDPFDSRDNNQQVLNEWREKKRIWELVYPEDVPDVFVDRVRDTWRSEKFLEACDPAFDSWTI